MSEPPEEKTRMALELLNRSHITIVCETTACICLIVFSLSGNILVLMAAFRNPILRRSFYILVNSLAVSDILLALLVLTFTCRSTLVGRWDLGDVFCQLQGFALAGCGFVSIVLMSCIAVSRYVKIVYPAKSTTVFTKRFFHLINIASWVFILLPLSLLSSHVKFSFNPGILVCSLDFDKIPFVVVFWFLFYGANYSIIFFCYYKIWRYVKNHSQAMANSQVNAEELKTIRILFAVVVAFTLCVSPLFICGAVDMAFGLCTSPRQVYVAAGIMYVTSSCVNPVIYGFMNQTYRKEFVKLICAVRKLWCFSKFEVSPA